MASRYVSVMTVPAAGIVQRWRSPLEHAWGTAAPASGTSVAPAMSSTSMARTARCCKRSAIRA
ncbi:MAG: hypothetical protein U0470_07670 [Anaerolineae bacterium]